MTPDAGAASPRASTEPPAPEGQPHRRLLPDEGAGAEVIAVDAGATPTVVMVDGAGTVLDAAPATAALLGRDDLVGEDLATYLAPDERPALQRLIALALADDPARARGFEALLTGRRADGLPLVVRIAAPGGVDTSAAALVLERWGGPVTAVGAPTVAGPPRSGPDHLLSHDARGAVRNTRNFGGIFARKVGAAGPGGGAPLDAEGNAITFELLDTALRSAANADEMLERVVWFIRLEHEPLSMQDLALGALIDQARQQAEATGAALAEAHGDPDLAGAAHTSVDPAAAALAVLGDGELLSWCFAELLVNARKFAGPATHVSFAARSHEGWVHVDVTSTGLAIDPDLAEDAFRLGRMLQPRGDRPGVGMGLPLLRRIVTRHGGRVLLSSSDGPRATTTFRLRLPAGVQQNLV